MVRVITAFEIKVMIKVKHQLKINVLLGAEKYSVVQNVIEYKNSWVSKGSPWSGVHRILYWSKLL